MVILSAIRTAPHVTNMMTRFLKLLLVEFWGFVSMERGFITMECGFYRRDKLQMTFHMIQHCRGGQLFWFWSRAQKFLPGYAILLSHTTCTILTPQYVLQIHFLLMKVDLHNFPDCCLSNSWWGCILCYVISEIVMKFGPQAPLVYGLALGVVR